MMTFHRVLARNFTRSSSLQLRGNRIKDLLENAAGGENEPQNENDAQANLWATTPYPQGAILRQRDQSKKSRRSNKDPRDTSIILFPGQGSQYVGMAKNLVKIPEAKDMFELASEVLG